MQPSLSVKSAMDSSVKKTVVQALIVLVTWAHVNCKRSWICSCVNWMRNAGRCDLDLTSCNRFLIRTLVAFCKPFLNVFAFQSPWRVAFRTNNWFWAWVVERSRPPECRGKTFPVIIETMLWNTPMTWATCFYKNQPSSIQIHLPIMTTRTKFK